MTLFLKEHTVNWTRYRKTNKCLLCTWYPMRGGELGGGETRREGLHPLEHHRRLSGRRDAYLVTKYVSFFNQLY